MRSIRLAVLIGSTLVAALLLVPSAVGLVTGPTLALAAPAQVSFSGPTNIGTGDGPVSVAAGNFDADQDPDLAVANWFSENVSVLLGGANGTFGTPTNFSTGGGTYPFSVAAGNFNGDQDQDPDLAVASIYTGNVSVLLGGAGGSFGAPTDFPIGDSPYDTPYAVAVGEFNGDNDPDLAVANQGSNNVAVLLGGAGGTFGVPTSYATGAGPSSVAVADFNGDNRPDLAVANQFEGNVSVLLGGAGGTFGALTNFPAGQDPTSIVVADFNGDQRPDLAVTDYSLGEVLVLAGGGNGTFSAATQVSSLVGSGPIASAVGDLNGDQDPDLVIANQLLGNVSVLVGGANASFSGPFNFTTGAGPSSIAVRDFDADGKPDLAVANVNSDNVSVLLNNTPTPNHAPVANNDTYSTNEDTTLTVAPALGVLGNDTDADGNPLTATVVTDPAHGTLTLHANGAFTYTPAANYNGPDTFTYRASDGTATSGLATVTITVTAVNDAPSVTVVAGGTCGTDDRSGTINLTVGDVESAATALTLSAASSNPALVPSGNVVFAGSGAARTLTARAVAGRTGTAVVTVTVSDGQATSFVRVTVWVGSNGNDTLNAGATPNLLFGQNGNDTLTGGGVYDLLCGGSGDDSLSGGGGDDSLGGGAGNDRLSGGPGADSLSGGAGNDRLTGGPGADRFSGGSGTDTTTDFAAAEGDTSDGTIP